MRKNLPGNVVFVEEFNKARKASWQASFVGDIAIFNLSDLTAWIVTNVASRAIGTLSAKSQQAMRDTL